MQLAQQLKAAGLGAFPCVVQYNEIKRRWDKRPITVNHESWALTGARPIDDPAVAWQGTTVLGLPIPDRVIVLDGDHYKDSAATPAGVDAVFGMQAPWAAALIQTTIGGGCHYAFKVPADWPAHMMRQGSDIFGKGSAFDSRVAGKGFICTGEGYTPADAFGVMRMAAPDSLPELPRELLPVFIPPAPAEPQERHEVADAGTITDALRHIDPSFRTDWFDVGCALKNIFHDNTETGFAIWDAWSAGEFWEDGCPAGYAAETQRFQWDTMRATRDSSSTITGGTLYHKAMRGGWIPPAQFDTSAAFGVGAVPVAAFSALVDRIMEEGADSRKTEELLAAITTSGCNEVQALLLRNELKSVMRSAKILDKALSAAIDKQTAPASAVSTAGLYAANDSDNAALFLTQHHPNSSLIKCDGEFYAYTGRCWENVPADTLKHQVAVSMAPARLQVSRIKSCFEMISAISPVHQGGMQRAPKHKIIFNNGVLDVTTGVLSAHSPEYLTTNLLPYDYNPGATCGEWLAFLHNTLAGDQERIALLQEWVGYLLTNDYRHHKVMLLLGPKRCGKGTIGRVIQQIVGEANFSGGSLSAFATDSFIDSLRAKPVLFIGDAEKRIAPAKVNQVIERIKSISGNDSVAFDRKFLSGLSETLPTRFTIAANSVPNLFDDSGALASRLLVLPFTRSFLGFEDLALADRLLAELPGIASWALEGLRRLNQTGRFTTSIMGQAETQYIREAYSPLARFLAEACALEPSARCTSADLHTAYRAWCLNEGEDILKRKTFIGAIKDATRGSRVEYGPHRFDDGSRGRGFTGVRPVAMTSATGTASAFTPQVVK